MFNNIPKELEDIINNYKNQIEHSEKFSKCLNEINEITYKLENPTKEDCEYHVRTTLERWRRQDRISFTNVYPYSLSYCYKNRSFRKFKGKEISYYYAFNQLILDDFHSYKILECNEIFYNFA